MNVAWYHWSNWNWLIYIFDGNVILTNGVNIDINKYEWRLNSWKVKEKKNRSKYGSSLIWLVVCACNDYTAYKCLHELSVPTFSIIDKANNCLIIYKQNMALKADNIMIVSGREKSVPLSLSTPYL